MCVYGLVCEFMIHTLPILNISINVQNNIAVINICCSPARLHALEESEKPWSSVK